VTVGLIMALTNDPVPEDDFFQPETVTTTRNVVDGVPSPPPPRTISVLDPRLPQVTARRLPDVAWFYTDSSDPMDVDAVESDEFASEMARGPVLLAEGQFSRAGTTDHVYVTSIQARGDQVVERAAAHLMLLDGSDRVFAQANVPLMLVGGTNTPSDPHTLRIPVGADLRSRVIRVRSRIQDVQLLRAPARL